MATACEFDDPVLRLVVERALDGSKPRARADGARVALAIEGGGMAGAVSAGMCVALEALGLIDSFDVVYGSSAGSINGSYTAAGQAQLRAHLYVLAARRGLVDARRMLVGHPPFRLAEIVNSLFVEHPHAPDVLEQAPRFRVAATRVEDKALDVLGEFSSLDELRAAVSASCSIPGITGDVVEFRGGRYVDGALIESLPYGVALREDATHVLVLRSRPASYRLREYRGARRRLLDRLLRDAPETVIELARERPARYNAEARDLESAEPAGLAGRVTQLAPPPAAPLARQLEGRPQHVLRAIHLGADTVHRALAVATNADPLPAWPASPRVAVAA